MRKEVTVLGLGQGKEGISKKSGKKYDFREVAVGYDSVGFTGMKCETLAIDSQLLQGKNVSVGDVLDMVYHQVNFKTYVDAIL